MLPLAQRMPGCVGGPLTQDCVYTLPKEKKKKKKKVATCTASKFGAGIPV